MLNKIKQDAEIAMKKALEHTVKEFSTIHTGKAAPSMVENLQVEAYGSMMRLKDTASVSTPDARSIVITPFDKSIIKDIEKAILGANIGLTPANMGSYVRCNVPELSGERRAELVKVANRFAEAGRVGVRNCRRDALEHVKKINKDKTASEDDCKRTEKDIQTLTDKYIAEVEKALKAKEADLQKV